MKKKAAKGKIDWFFPPNNFGQEFGLHDAGVETFRGDYYRYLAREVIQNSLDARLPNNKPAVVKFEQLSIPRKSLPAIDELADVFDRCKAYWSEKASKDFFKRAKALIAADTIDAIRIGDYNTTGVEGEDHDRKNKKNWYTLTRCSGSSSKEGGEGGSYGIGKNAPFAASNMRAVLYSTNTGGNKVAFQGVARLVTHEGEEETAQHIGYLGGENGASIRDLAKIPKLFQRKERGTDVVILGFIAEPTWQDQIRLSVLANFWPAIHFGDLEVEIGDLRITKKNLAKLLESMAKDDASSAYAYYQCFKSADAKFEESLPNLKQVSLHLSGGQIELPKKVAMVRKSGMVIYEKQVRAPMPFCGVFICRNGTGNALLRAMEPPRHDYWDSDLPEKGANKDIEREFSTYLKDCVRELLGKDDAKVINIPELSRFLPDDDDIAEDPLGGSAEAEQDKVEGFPDKPKEPLTRKKLATSKMTKSKPRVVTPGTEEVEDEDENEHEGGGKGTKKKVDGITPKTAIPIQFRAFATDPYGSSYTVTARSLEKKTGMLVLTIVGDDTRAPIRLSGAWLPNGKAVAFDPGGRIGPIPFAPGKPTKIDIDLEAPDMLAMEGTAYEA